MTFAGAPDPIRSERNSQDRKQALRSEHVLLGAICAFGFLIDIGEISIASALAAIFTVGAGGHTSTTAVSILLSSTYVGGAAGAIGFGMLARRRSTRLAITLSMALLGMASLVAAFAPNIEVLIAARAIGGLGIGAYPPLAIALLTTHLPARSRGRVILTASAIGSLGAPLMVFATRHLSLYPVGGLAGWQSALIAGAIGAFAVSIGFALLRDFEGDDRRPDGLAGVAAETLRHSLDGFTARIVLPALYILAYWAGVGFPLLSGVIMLGKGFNLNDALLFVAATMLGPTIGTLASGLVIDRFPRRDAVFATLVLGALALLVFGFSDSAWLLGLAAVLFGFALGLYTPVMSLYAAELYPREQRSSATSRLWAMNRISVAIAPLCLLPLLHRARPLALMLVLAALLITCAVLIRLAPAGHANEELA